MNSVGASQKAVLRSSTGLCFAHPLPHPALTLPGYRPRSDLCPLRSRSSAVLRDAATSPGIPAAFGARHSPLPSFRRRARNDALLNAVPTQPVCLLLSVVSTHRGLARRSRVHVPMPPLMAARLGAADCRPAGPHRALPPATTLGRRCGCTEPQARPTAPFSLRQARGRDGASVNPSPGGRLANAGPSP